MSLLGPVTGPSGSRGPFGRALALVWAAIYAVGLALTIGPDAPGWVWVASFAGALAWAARILIPDRLPTAQIALEAVMILIGGAVLFSAQVLGGVPVAVALVLIIARPERPIWMGPIAVLLALASLGVGALIAPRGHPNTLALGLGGVGTVAIAALIGVTRRQARIGAVRTEELRESEHRAERLDDHARVARDLHDVLAHGLGGLVVQLDAVDALLESGRTEEAAQRVRAARALARDGLGDARRAVDALRADGDEPPVEAGALLASLRELIAAHRALGGRAEDRIDVGSGIIPGPTATAIRRALQESLANARKHAPGAPVTVRLERRDGVAHLRVENPTSRPGELARSGSGRGLDGMRERFARIPGGRVRAEETDGIFLVDAEAVA